MHDFSESKELSPLASYFLKEKLLDFEILKLAIDEAKQLNLSLITFLVKSKKLSAQVILNCCMKYFTFPYFNLTNYQINHREDFNISLEQLIRYRVLPIEKNHHILKLGLADPSNHEAIAAMHFQSGMEIQPLLVEEDKLDQIITEQLLAEKLPQFEITLEIKNDESINQFLEHLIKEAMNKYVSDIHLEPGKNNYRIRFRIDGMLREMSRLNTSFAIRLISCIKIMANMDIAEKRLPQDGRLPFPNLNIDIRLNTCPTIYGEKIVLRFFNKHFSDLVIEKLGMTNNQLHCFTNAILKPQGLILISGPTGSGKTLTLYSALNYLNCAQKNIITIEDPVEIELEGINQVNVNPKIGLGFDAILPALLRQDPDIIMIGEIRSRETAKIAIHAAQTGHLVLSTLHTSSAEETICRLISLDIPVSDLLNSINLIISQRLIRRLCSFCHKHTPSCLHCDSGYKGRNGIFEFINWDRKKLKFNTHYHINQLIHLVNQSKDISLYEAGIQKIKEGTTDLNELKRVIG